MGCLPPAGEQGPSTLGWVRLSPLEASWGNMARCPKYIVSVTYRQPQGLDLLPHTRDQLTRRPWKEQVTLNLCFTARLPKERFRQSSLSESLDYQLSGLELHHGSEGGQSSILLLGSCHCISRRRGQSGIFLTF